MLQREWKHIYLLGGIEKGLGEHLVRTLHTPGTHLVHAQYSPGTHLVPFIFLLHG